MDQWQRFSELAWLNFTKSCFTSLTSPNEEMFQYKPSFSAFLYVRGKRYILFFWFNIG